MTTASRKELKELESEAMESVARSGCVRENKEIERNKERKKVGGDEEDGEKRWSGGCGGGGGW